MSTTSHIAGFLNGVTNRMFLIKESRENERGAILVVALVLMVALVMMGSLAAMITVTERNISRNHKVAKEAFYVADGGYPLAVTVMEDIMKGELPSYADFALDEHLANEVMDYHGDDAILNDRERDSPEYSPDISALFLSHTLRIDIDRTSTSLLYGGSAEFASGSESVGIGGGASKKILFQINAQGRMKNGALSSVVTVYRNIL